MLPRIWVATSRMSVSAKSNDMSPASPVVAEFGRVTSPDVPYETSGGDEARGAPTSPLIRGGAALDVAGSSDSAGSGGGSACSQPARTPSKTSSVSLQTLIATAEPGRAGVLLAPRRARSSDTAPVRHRGRA